MILVPAIKRNSKAPTWQIPPLLYTENEESSKVTLEIHQFNRSINISAKSQGKTLENTHHKFDFYPRWFDLVNATTKPLIMQYILKYKHRIDYLLAETQCPKMHQLVIELAREYYFFVYINCTSKKRISNLYH